jgi:DNA topoisomerase VI subunit A
MKESFRDDLHLNKKNEEQLTTVNKILDEFAEQGYTLTLRQLYYQLVTRNIIPNLQKEYAKLSSLLVKGRMAGVVDWDAIEDRIRIPFIPYSVDDIDGALQDTINQYRLDRQDGQDVYIELWVEKDALSGVLKRITSHYHINLMVNRGYSSCSAMHDAFKRLEDKEDEGKKTVILYLGDHDPSGLDMIRDIRERLEEFGVNPEVRHIGLTMKQIKKYNPPPNPAKITDPRAKWYINEFGNVSWEVDALTPKVLHELVKKNVEELIDMDLFNDKIIQEEKDKETLREFTEK